MVTVVSPSPQQYHGSSLVLEGITWQTYQGLVHDLNAQPGKRLTYDQGVLEISMPLPPHETYKRWLGRWVEIITEELDIEIRSLGSCTWSRQDLLKGIEADECYYIQHEAAVRGKMWIDLTVDPPPDLAIEVDITSPSLPRLPIYAALQIPEVWQFDGERMHICCLVSAAYEERPQSHVLPIATATGIEAWMAKAQVSGETSWAKQVRQWVSASQG
ncbi:Uma2 family endonuclease [Synechococcales cyanobacterium C]|uniref:Uma2 family endonuclease n=1 Tax=Petrachloros mirabilis ULC683 TaxID=2781853 RepID=A0A8K1ZYZ0_9CYAN|nr:Uma2 family endonuclease [Petrachloros mirabilis]NCJ06422.1 Uma2 family endonuclease [Petrachloros mirabilis ULC683]